MFDEVNYTATLKIGASLATNDLFHAENAQDEPTLSTIAKRFSAMARVRHAAMTSGGPLAGGNADIEQTSTSRLPQLAEADLTQTSDFRP